ncbi:TIGR04084 family radical SAM/SPASM domain-containing protein [Candidatus Korarchaeum cryptofilum]|uniref:Radical SAM domain protein n=1 Tax=Korarchaeum cryptofilum (strain OPF8) TaxID=374847 RepID=B1L7F5_KORCO|nr:TIGR04084 family radical SAM/SPASM domain-containing protein [Candidatus Korarchaeum cryptofilum]ACB06782.1 Radical SAM domain protein [Candidatus Korarchaeum cryptofilum OPF8]
MILIVTTTGKCNMKCLYCGGSFDPKLVPWSEGYRLEDLVDLVVRTGCDVAFYGGEPLLNPKLVMDVIDSLKSRDWRGRFIIQTNGTLFESLPLSYWLSFDSILLSVDGRPEVNDEGRGKGNYKRAIETARNLRKYGFSGDLIARMTAWERTDIYEEVTHLLSLGLFDHIHWQLNVIWSERWDFRDWSERSYLPGLRKLASLWLGEMRKGKILGIVPFLGIMRAELFGDLPSPPCGAGSESFTLLPNGKILACPIAVDSSWAVVGELGNGIREVSIGEPCKSCDYFKYCGGRCLYAYMERLWGEEGFREVCTVTKETIKIVLEHGEEIRSLIREGVISAEDLYYPRYNNTVEVIP